MLPYVRNIDFLSPSSLFEFERYPVLFYLKRLGPLEFRPPRSDQTGPMAVGTVFDAHVKSYIGHKIGRPPLMNLIKEGLSPEHLKIDSPVLEEGLRLFKLYCASPAMDMLFEDGIDHVEVPTDTVTVGSHKLVGKDFGGVPIYGKPDASMTKDGIMIVLDWKVNGSLSKNGASPHQGYLRLWDRGRDMGPHKNYGRFLEDLNEAWATQLTMYHWMMGEYDPSTPSFLKCAIDQVSVKPDNVRFAQIRAPISPDFQRSLMLRLKVAWEAIQEGRVVDEKEFGDDPALLAMMA